MPSPSEIDRMGSTPPQARAAKILSAMRRAWEWMARIDEKMIGAIDQGDEAKLAALLRSHPAWLDGVLPWWIAEGTTGLMEACRYGRSACARLLCSRSDLYARDDQGRTALMVACENHAYGCALAILNHCESSGAAILPEDAASGLWFSMFRSRRGEEAAQLACVAALAILSGDRVRRGPPMPIPWSLDTDEFGVGRGLRPAFIHADGNELTIRIDLSTRVQTVSDTAPEVLSVLHGHLDLADALAEAARLSSACSRAEAQGFAQTGLRSGRL